MKGRIKKQNKKTKCKEVRETFFKNMQVLLKSKVKFVSAVGVHLLTYFLICLSCPGLTVDRKKKKACPVSFADLPVSCRQRGAGLHFFLCCGSARMVAHSGLL